MQAFLGKNFSTPLQIKYLQTNNVLIFNSALRMIFLV